MIVKHYPLRLWLFLVDLVDASNSVKRQRSFASADGINPNWSLAGFNNAYYLTESMDEATAILCLLVENVQAFNAGWNLAWTRLDSGSIVIGRSMRLFTQSTLCLKSLCLLDDQAVYGRSEVRGQDLALVFHRVDKLRQRMDDTSSQLSCKRELGHRSFEFLLCELYTWPYVSTDFREAGGFMLTAHRKMISLWTNMCKHLVCMIFGLNCCPLYAVLNVNELCSM